MANYYLDFVGLNTLIYEPVGYDPDNQYELSAWNLQGYETHLVGDGGEDDDVASRVEQNMIGPGLATGTGTLRTLYKAKNGRFSHELPNTASFFPALMLHRNGPYGYPTWKQIRAGQNPLTRKQVKNNIFTYISEPGPAIAILGAQVNRRYGDINSS